MQRVEKSKRSESSAARVFESLKARIAILDLQGKVIAVNDHDAAGKPVDTSFIYQKNFKDAVWFKESLAGNFLKSGLKNEIW